MRQSAVVRTKEACNEGELKNSPCVTTNLMYLYRYAKALGSQQKIEITKEEQTMESVGDADGSAANRDGLSGICVKQDVHVKDYIPAMKAVCDKLQEANDKVNPIEVCWPLQLLYTLDADCVSLHSFIEGSCCLGYKKGSWLLWSSFRA